MTIGQEIESVLAIDEGTITTKAVLIDQVDGVYRFIAKGEVPNVVAAPESDVMVGLVGALQQLENTTGRAILSADGNLLSPERADGNGVDALVASLSILPPLRVVIAGMIADLSVESARRAVNSTYALVQDIIALNEGAQRWGGQRGIEAKLEALCEDPPDVILLVGGVDGGAVSPLLDIARVIAAVASVVESARRPTVIYAGNEAARSAIAGLLADDFEFLAVDNVRPRLDVESLTGVRDELERLYSVLGLKRLPGFRTLPDWSSAPILSAAKAFELVIRFIARQYGLVRGVLGVDLGGANVQVFASLGQNHYGVVKCDFGVGLGLPALLERVDIQDIARWLPIHIPVEDIRNRIHNKALRPLSVPQEREDLFLEQALAREELRLALQEMASQWQIQGDKSWDGVLPPVDLIVGSGSVLSHVPHAGQAAMILLDALQPVGLSRLVLDRLSILPALGSVAALHPLAAAQVLDQDGFLELGTVIAPLGVARVGDIALRLKVSYGDGSTINVEVPYGSLEVIPLPLGQTAMVEVHPSRRFDIGWGNKGRGGRIEIKGGAVGVIVDARGRPLAFSDQVTTQQSRVQEWLWSVGG